MLIQSLAATALAAAQMGGALSPTKFAGPSAALAAWADPQTRPATPTWSRPRSDERAEERAAMVRTQIASRGVRDPAVLEAMRRVSRHWFVPAGVEASAYDDRPLPIGEGQTISQPYIVAFMTEALKLDSHAKVLERIALSEQVIKRLPSAVAA